MTSAPPAPSKNQTSTVSILFVCVGNICRSPMAEGHFRSLTAFDTTTQHPSIAAIDSCGVAAYHAGEPPDERTRAVLHGHGITTYRHAARRVRIPDDLRDFDYILAMDEGNLRDLRRLAADAIRRDQVKAEEVGTIALYGEFDAKAAGNGRAEEVRDPYYDGHEAFDVCFEQVERFGRGLLEAIEARSKES